MIRSEEIFEIGGPVIIGTQIHKDFGNTEKLFATFGLVVSLPILNTKDLGYLRDISQRSMHGYIFSSKML